MSSETTTSYDITDRETARLYILSLSETVGTRLRKAGLYAGVVAVNIKNSGFKSYSRQKKLSRPTQDTNDIFSTAAHLFDQVWKREPIRLIGVAVSQLEKEPALQMDMFEEVLSGKKDGADLNKSIDKIREKYGSKYVVRASLLNFNRRKKHR